VSFEHTPECTDATLECVARLASLGPVRFNYSEGESLRLAWETWRDAADLRAALEAMRGDVHTFGDVYARFEPGAAAEPAQRP
jgi:hypothetical protein